MNSIMRDYYPTFELYQAMRKELMEAVADVDLAYTPGGANPSLGALCLQMGEVEQAYLTSFKTFELDFSYRNPTPGLQNSVAQLSAWYAALDADLKTTIEALPQETIDNQRVRRTATHQPPIQVQLAIYQEALLIFYGRVVVYLLAAGIKVPPQMQDWLL